MYPCAVVFLFSAALDRCIIRLVEASGKATKITDGKKISKWTINQKKTGGVMFEVTEKASEMIKEFLKNQKDQQTIRITLQAG